MSAPLPGQDLKVAAKDFRGRFESPLHDLFFLRGREPMSQSGPAHVGQIQLRAECPADGIVTLIAFRAKSR
jgi:hypothetical protein